MKKILFITHTISNGGGAEKVLNTLIDELSSEYEIDVLEWLEDTACPFWERKRNVRHIGSITYSDRMASQLGKNVLINRIRHNIIALINTFFPRFLYKHHIKGKYDYEISFNYLYTSALVGFSKNKSSKKIMWMHGAIDDLNATYKVTNIKYMLYKWLQRRAFNRSDAIVTISKRTHQSVSQFKPDIEHRVVDIYNGYDFGDIIKKSKEKEITKGNSFRLISLGRLTSAKNIFLQLEALNILLDRGINIELLILGEGELEDEVRKFASNNPNIKLMGFKSNPYPYIASSDCLIITSYSEGFPTIAVEAMILEKPVISTPVAGTEELITPETGRIVDWHPESVANGIMDIMATTFDSNKIKQHISPYTKENWAANVKKLLNKLDNES